jgi:hypothetical protein
MFKDNKYTKMYFRLVENAKSSIRDGYVEAHHIIPRCLGGPDEEENLVLLSYREHYICHALLIKMHDSDKLKLAYWAMSNQNKCKYYKSRLYAQAKREYVDSISGENHWAKNEDFRKQVSKSWNQTRKKSFSLKVSGNNHWSKRVDMTNHAEYMRSFIDHEAVSKAQSAMMRERNPMKDPNIAAKLKKPKIRVICPHCNKEGGKPIMIRYHFNNCKERKANIK